MQKEFCMYAIDWIKKTKEIIDFALQLEASIFHEEIRPQHILKEVCVESGSDDYFVNRDWALYSDVLKEDFAKAIKLNTVSYQIIILKESYAGLFDEKSCANRIIEPDLWAAQQILKHIRNALGHFKAKPGEFEAKATWVFSKDIKKDDKEYPKKLIVRSIGLVIDMELLNHNQFNWEQIGGIKKFISLLEYLIKDLEGRL